MIIAWNIYSIHVTLSLISFLLLKVVLNCGTPISLNIMTTHLTFSRFSAQGQKSSEQRLSEGFLEFLVMGCWQQILWVLWAVEWDLCELGLVSDAIRSHLIGILGVAW